ncbi:MAG: hybrid sensor histidine kinase/response regulator [Acidobacteria bacterium]|nr:hybrid sensor histidine kinase/response regulator [Acidobacteriota bacterium]
MSTGHLQAFIEEAESYLPMIRNLILVCGQERSNGSELETSLRYSQAIKDAATMTGLIEIGKSSEKLEFEIADVIAGRQPIADVQTRTILDRLAQVEALLAKAQLTNDDFSINLDGFLDESFENLTQHNGRQVTAEVTETVPEPVEEVDLEGFEIDEEMLEIFAMEAEDLLRNIQTNLQTLESKPNEREALLEIRRNAHTLKGSAGIVGLKPLSDLAHRVEDLLDFVSEQEIEGDRKIFELLMASTDCLSALAAGESSPELSQRISRLYKDFENALKSLKLEDEWEESITEAPSVEKPVSVAAKTAEPTVPQTEPTPKSVIRVSLEKLDELVRLVGDLVLTRSVFEQRLGDLERQAGELRHSTERLKKSTGKLETDFEASMLGGNGLGFSQTLNSARQPHQFDSLEFDRYTEFHQTTRELLETTGDATTINSELDNLRGSLELLYDGQSRLIDELQDRLLRLRMVRFDSLAARLNRTVRVTCEQECKSAELVIEGEATEVDTQIIDALVEPLLHLLRNAVAHGIESPDTRRMLGKPEKGKIVLRIHSEGTHIVLTLKDDGRGISASALKEKALQSGAINAEEAAAMSEQEAYSLCFLPGITTAETLRQTAGRGVGMNIIRESVIRRQGTIRIDSELQKGTEITIRMPMALAVTRGLLVKVAGQVFALPMKLVKKLTEIPAEDLSFVLVQNTAAIDGVEYPATHLNSLLRQSRNQTRRESASVLLVDTLETSSALLVDEVLRADEIVIKPLGSPLQDFPHLLGVTILGDGSVVPVLDLIYLLKHQVQAPRPQFLVQFENKVPETVAPADEIPFESPVEPQTLRVMVVDDSPSVRHIMSKLIKNAGWEAIVAKDGLEALDLLQSTESLPNVILTDVEMPRMNGYDLLASLKGNDSLKQIPVIMITSRASEKHEQKAIELCVSSYLTKPFDDSFLVDEIKNLTESVAA